MLMLIIYKFINPIYPFPFYLLIDGGWHSLFNPGWADRIYLRKVDPEPCRAL